MTPSGGRSPVEAVSVTVECAPRLRPTPEYVALEDALRAAGFEPTYRAPIERHAAGAASVIAAVYLADRLSSRVLAHLTDAVVDWAQTHLRRLLPQRGASDAVVIPIYGPGGEVLREVVVPRDDDQC